MMIHLGVVKTSQITPNVLDHIRSNKGCPIGSPLNNTPIPAPETMMGSIVDPRIEGQTHNQSSLGEGTVNCLA